MTMKSLKENSVFMVADSEELDYEDEGENISTEKCYPVKSKNEHDIEDGEIIDPETYICEFFQYGKCFHENCRYFHVTDKGLYKMLDSPPTIIPTLKIACTAVQSSSLDISDQNETDWDRALKEAKKLVKQYKTKMNVTGDASAITRENSEKRSSNKSTEKPRRYRSPEPKVLDISSDSDNFNGNVITRKDSKKRPLNKSTKKPYSCRSSEPKNLDIPPGSGNFSGNVNTRESNKKRTSSKSIEKPRSYRSPEPKILKDNFSGSVFTRENSKKKPLSKSTDKLRSYMSPEPKILNDSSIPYIFSRSVTRESNKKRSLINSAKKPRSYRFPDLKILHNSSDSDNYNGFLKQKLSGNKNECHRSIIWHDRWTKSNAFSSKDKLKKARSSSSSSEHCSQSSCHQKDNPSRFDEHCKNANNRYKRRSSSLSSSASTQCLRKKSFKKEEKPQTTKTEKNNLSSMETKSDKNKRMQQSVKDRTIPIVSDNQTNDVLQWIQHKMRLPTPPPPPRSCSDMSISPLTDSSLSDLFEQNSTTDQMERTRQHKSSWSRPFLVQQTYQTEVYGPVCPQESEVVAKCMPEVKQKAIQCDKLMTKVHSPKVKSKIIPKLLEVKNKEVTHFQKCVGENKTVHLSKFNKTKKQITDILEADLMKFQPEFRREILEKSTSKNVQQKVSEMNNKTSKNESIIKSINDIPKEIDVVQLKQVSRKEMLLKQLEAINAAIESKKKMYTFQK